MRLVQQKRRKERGKLKPGVSAAEGTPDSIVRRLFVTDYVLGRKFVDTEADVSVIPVARKERHNKSSFTLCAANRTPISTYGQRLLWLNFGLRRDFQWPFRLAAVSKPILGIDFLSHFNLLADIRRRKLVDNTRLKVPGQISSISALQVPCFRSNMAYSNLLNEFPELIRSSIAPKNVKYGVAHAIVTKGQSVAAKARRLAPEKLKVTKLEFEFMLQQGLCRPSKSCWTSLLHLVPKNGDWRPCGDYRKLNAITEPDCYPIPFLQNCVQFLHEATVFSTVDLVRAYQQIPVKEGGGHPQNSHNNAFWFMNFLSWPLGYATLPKHSKGSWMKWFEDTISVTFIWTISSWHQKLQRSIAVILRSCFNASTIRCSYRYHQVHFRSVRSLIPWTLHLGRRVRTLATESRSHCKFSWASRC